MKSQEDSTALSYATVRLLDKDQKIITAGITNEDGEFMLPSSRKVSQIQVGFIGFETANYPVEKTGELSVIYLRSHDYQLKETVVSGSLASHQLDRTIFQITPPMCEQAHNALELLELLPKISTDFADHVVKTGKDQPVLLLVDGIHQSQEYIKNISSERIAKIELIHEPSGRFVSDNYSAILNIILKKEYIGYDLSLRNTLRINPSGKSGTQWLAKEQPEISFSFTRNKFNIYTYYSYQKEQVNLLHYRFLDYGSAESSYYRTRQLSRNHPNKYEANHWVTGINYQLTPSHQLTFQSTYGITNSSSENYYQLSTNPAEIPNDYLQTDTTITRIKDKDLGIAAFYKGNPSGKLFIYSELTYNKYSDEVYNFYQQVDLFTKENIFKEKKDQTSFNLEGDFRFHPRHSVISGYANNWRKYTSHSSTGDQFIDYKESINKVYFYFISHLTPSLQTKIGTSLELIDTRSIGYRHSQKALQPYILLNYAINNSLIVNVSYITNTDHPALYQLSIMPLTYDSVLSQKGNPELQTSLNYLFSTRLSYKDFFFFKAELKHSPKGITETFEQINHYFYLTYDNAKIRQYTLQADLHQPITQGFTWRNSVIYYYDKLYFQDLTNRLHGWLIHSQLDYYNYLHQFGMQLGYHKRMYKNSIWQGYRMTDTDKWEINVKKYLINKQVTLTLSYIPPPIDWGIQYKQRKEIHSPTLQEESYTSMKAYRNCILFRVEIRLNQGKSPQGRRANPEEIISKDRRRLNPSE